MGRPMKLMATEINSSPTSPLNFQRPMANRMKPMKPTRLRKVGFGSIVRVLLFKGT